MWFVATSLQKQRASVFDYDWILGLRRPGLAAEIPGRKGRIP
jgi:hypothetical protein